ncbi:MAG: DUF2190 family protein [Rhizobiales bacterium]|jgi:hypothetical protein|nr:DUF2190 family protein [Hyphomicrobiales bacterium]
MSDLSITPANVLAGASADIEYGTAGEAITAGQIVYRDETTRKYMKADSNSPTAAARQARGIALNGAANGQPLVILKKGDITIGAAVVAGTAYFLSDTPGGICPLADVGNGEYICQLGLAKSTSVLTIDVQFPNVAVAT